VLFYANIRESSAISSEGRFCLRPTNRPQAHLRNPITFTCDALDLQRPHTSPLIHDTCPDVVLNMAPNGATSRKSTSQTVHRVTRTANTIATAPAPTQKARDSKLLGNLFEELEDITSPKLKTEVKANLPVVKKLGNWDSESGNGMP
jgi:hypothetical protein